MKDKANAKINLLLRIVGTRPDGYHELEMLNLSLDLADSITLENSDEDSIEIGGDFAGLADIPRDERNLAMKAVARWREASGESERWRIRIEKRIPAGGGLAGGSTDAAAVLRMLGGVSERTLALAARIGADVPFCLHRSPAIVKGIGEIITPITLKEPLHVVVVNPGIHTSTREIFDRFDREPRSSIDPSSARNLADALKSGDQRAIARFVSNDLERITENVHPEVRTIRERLAGQGAFAARMSGSGSSVYGLFESGSSAARAAAEWTDTGYWHIATRSIG